MDRQWHFRQHLTLTWGSCIHCFHQGKRGTQIVLRPKQKDGSGRYRSTVKSGFKGFAQIVGAHLRKVHPEIWAAEQRKAERLPGTGAAAV